MDGTTAAIGNNCMHDGAPVASLDTRGKRDSVIFDARLAEDEVQRTRRGVAIAKSQFDFVASHLILS